MRLKRGSVSLWLALALGVSVFMGSCGPGQFLGPTVTPTPSSTVTPSLTATRTPTATITLTPTITPIAGAPGLGLMCDIGNNSSYYRYDLASRTFTPASTSLEYDEKNTTMFQLEVFGVQTAGHLPFLEQALGGKHILAVSADRNHILAYEWSAGTKLLHGISVDDETTKVLFRYSKSTIQEQQHSPDGNQVILRIPNNTDQDLIVIDLRTWSLENLTAAETGTPSGISWHPDGESFLYTFFDHIAYEIGVWSAEPTGNSRNLLIPGGEGATWSLDGQRIAYDIQGALWIADSAGQDPIAVTSAGGSQVQAYNPQWVPLSDRNALVYWGDRGWFLHDLDENRQALLLPISEDDVAFRVLGFSFDWSPDGHWFIGSVIRRYLIGGMDHVYLCNVDQESCIHLAPTSPNGTGYCRFGWWIAPAR